jgi:hypothetical protein
MIVPFISVGWTVQMKLYVPACAKVQLPLQPVCSPSLGTPGQLGLSGPPVHFTPCGTGLGLLKATVPPTPIEAVDGFQ